MTDLPSSRRGEFYGISTLTINLVLVILSIHVKGIGRCPYIPIIDRPKIQINDYITGWFFLFGSEKRTIPVTAALNVMCLGSGSI